MVFLPGTPLLPPRPMSSAGNVTPATLRASWLRGAYDSPAARRTGTAYRRGRGAGAVGGRYDSAVVGINGFGRIGRAVLRAALDDPHVVVGAVNERHADDDNLLYLLRYDSVYGRLPHKIARDGDTWS